MSTQRILDTGNKILVERPSNSYPRNTFDLSHDVKLTANFGNLAPICVMEVLPGDIFHINSEALLRFQPMISPVMHRINLRSEWFFVPNRILWPNWEDFISPQFAGDSPAIPMFAPPDDYDVVSGSLSDYLGLPLTTGFTGDGLVVKCNALPWAAYKKICCDWYVDEDLAYESGVGTPIYTPLNDGAANDIFVWDVLQQRNWDRDYFTSAKPFPQKGDAVVIPIVLNDLPVTGTTLPDQITAGYSTVSETDPAAGSPKFAGASTVLEDSSGAQLLQNIGGLMQVAMTDALANAGTINDLRQAEALQKFLEADLRGGTRYAELIQQQFGVYSSDSRLQRAEYLGSTFQPISISEVLNTTGTDTAAQGQMAGHGVAVTKHRDGIHYSSEEHGFIIGIMSVLPVTGYFQGVHRCFLRQDRLDFAWPQLAQLGEQVITNIELFYGDTDADSQTFGYVPRYSEYRIQGNRVCGDFKGDLNFWHLDRQFETLPALTDGFIECLLDESLNRIFAVIDVDVAHLLAHWFHNIHVERKLPRYVKPSI